MSRLRIIARTGLVLSVVLLAAGSAASADLDPVPDLSPRTDSAPRPDLSRALGIDRMCEQEVVEVEIYPPAPRYVYDNRRGARWTGNGWVYLPIGEFPDEYAPRLVAPPPPHGVNPAEFLKIPCRVLDHLQHLPDYLRGR
jgi:hypothetical protein